ncbi:hypothetical protein J6S37_01620, partial [Candidatus Saccharibacteria bacterium]|nr:hypothetical protein [Candidatus Saccharibacteria bacterium]
GNGFWSRHSQVRVLPSQPFLLHKNFKEQTRTSLTLGASPAIPAIRNVRAFARIFLIVRGGRTRTVGSDAVGDERKSKIYFRFSETTPGVVLSRSESTSPAIPFSIWVRNKVKLLTFL